MPSKLQHRIREARDRAKLTQEQVAEALALKSREAVSQWEVGKSRPKLLNMKAFSKLTGAPFWWLMNDDVDVNSSYEQNLSHSSGKNGRKLGDTIPSYIRRVRLVSLLQARLGAQVADEQDEHALPCPVECGPRTFAVRITGVSNEPRIHDGECAFIDPDRAPEHLNFIMVDRDEWPDPRVRQYVEEGSRSFVRSGPQWPEPPQELDPDTRFLGVVIWVGREP